MHKPLADSNRNFLAENGARCIIQLEHVVFWSIVDAFVSIVNVLWPLPIYCLLLMSTVWFI